jgi:hypothetical protein
MSKDIAASYLLYILFLKVFAKRYIPFQIQRNSHSYIEVFNTGIVDLEILKLSHKWEETLNWGMLVGIPLFTSFTDMYLKILYSFFVSVQLKVSYDTNFYQ